MRTPARILIADDNPDNLEIFAGPSRRPRLRDPHGSRRRRGACRRQREAARPDPAGHHDAEDGRDRGLPTPQSGRLSPFHADHHGHREDGLTGRRRWPRSGRRRIPHQARGSVRAGGPGQVDAAHQGAARSGPGPSRSTRGTGRAACRMESRAGEPRCRASGATGAAIATEAVRVAPARRAASCLAAPTIRWSATAAK